MLRLIISHKLSYIWFTTLHYWKRTRFMWTTHSQIIEKNSFSGVFHLFESTRFLQWFIVDFCRCAVAVQHGHPQDYWVNIHCQLEIYSNNPSNPKVIQQRNLTPIQNSKKKFQTAGKMKTNQIWLVQTKSSKKSWPSQLTILKYINTFDCPTSFCTKSRDGKRWRFTFLIFTFYFFLPFSTYYCCIFLTRS